MAIGLTFEEYVELKRTPAENASLLAKRSAERLLEGVFPMSLAEAAGHARTRGYDCRPQTLELLVKQQVAHPGGVDAWTRADVDAVCDYFEEHGLYVPYAEMCRVLGCSYASFLRALKEAAERETQKYGIHVRADDQLFVMHRVPPRENQDAIITFTLCDDIRERLERGEGV